MSTSLLYHAFGIKDYDHQSIKFNEGHVIFTITRKEFSFVCPCCKSTDVIRRGSTFRSFYSLPIGNKQTFIKTNIPRVECKQCHKVRQIDIGFADERVTYTKALERYALSLSKYMTIKDIANHLGISWDIIKNLQKRYLQKKYKDLNYREMKRIAIDEINIGKGVYLTVVLNLETGAIVFVGDGKGSDALVPFWLKIKRKRSVQIEAVAIDMSPAYIKAVSENLPQAQIVFDHFHVVKLFNEKLSDFRRMLFTTTATESKKIVLKGSRWLLLMGNERLKERDNCEKRLHDALELNKSLAIAYYMKEDLRHLWSWRDKTTATWHLDSWIEMARISGVTMLNKFANTLEKHRDGILSFFKYRISTGPLEGTNNKIKTMKRQAYGFRDLEFFKLKIMALHETKYALVG
jgi:transposase